jgi:hypothetical protein
MQLFYLYIHIITYTMKKLILLVVPALFLGFATSCTEPNDGDLNNTAVKGCMNPAAANYNNKATLDDGSCVIVGKKQNSISAKFTATWCGPCGSFGAPAFESYYNDMHPKTLAFTLQVNDAIAGMYPGITPLMNGFKSYWGIGSLSTPSYAVNAAPIPNQNLTMARNVVNEKHAEDPKAGIGIKWTRGAGTNAGKINVNAYVEFFDAIPGDVKLGLYFIARELEATQKVGDQTVADFKHKHVLLGEATGADMYGTLIAEGGVSKGDVKHLSRVLVEPDGMDMTKLSLVGILWKANGTVHVFENGTLN